MLYGVKPILQYIYYQVKLDFTVCHFPNIASSAIRVFSLEHMNHDFHLNSMFSFQSLNEILIEFYYASLALVVLEPGEFNFSGKLATSPFRQQPISQTMLEIFSEVKSAKYARGKDRGRIVVAIGKILNQKNTCVLNSSLDAILSQHHVLHNCTWNDVVLQLRTKCTRFYTLYSFKWFYYTKLTDM